MKIRPQNAPGHPLTGIEHMVMIVPVDTDVYEAEDIAQKHGGDRRERSETVAVRNFHLKYHDGDDDRDDAVAERLEPVFAHQTSQKRRESPETTYRNRRRASIAATAGIRNSSASIGSSSATE